MDVLKGEINGNFMHLWLWRIVIEDQRKVLRQLRIFVQDLKQGRYGLAPGKLAVVQNDDR
jgi:hypothetical protein